MKLMHVLKSEPDDNTGVLMEILSRGNEATEFALYGEDVDYDRFLDMIFEHDRIVSWW